VKVTVPVGVPWKPDAVTTAVKVSCWPSADGLIDEVSAVAETGKPTVPTTLDKSDVLPEVSVFVAVFIGAVYVGIAVGIGTLIGSGGKPNLGLSIVATAVVAVGFQPLRERVQRLANRLVYGKRSSPYEVLSAFSSRVAESYASEEVLSRMVRVLAEGTGATEAGVWLRSGNQLRWAARWPEVSREVGPVSLTGQVLPELPADRKVAVRHQGVLLGALTVSKRKGESLTPIEEKLLEDLAHQAGLVLKNVGLTQDLKARLVELRASRQRLVAGCLLSSQPLWDLLLFFFPLAQRFLRFPRSTRGAKLPFANLSAAFEAMPGLFLACCS